MTDAENATVKPSLLGKLRGRDDEYAKSYREMLATLQRIYDMTGSLEIRPIIERANAALGRTPA